MRHLFLLPLLCLFACGLAAADPAPAADPAAAEVTVKDTPWCTVTVPKSAKVGEKATVKVAVKAGAVSVDSELHIDVHKFVGKDRKPGAGRAKPVKIAAGAAVETDFAFEPPADASAFVYIIYVLPPGSNDWKSRSHTTEAGVKVVN